MHSGPGSVGWGKAVPLPATPAFVAPAVAAAAAAASGLPFGAVPRGGGSSGSDVYVAVPRDAALRRRIHRTIELVLQHGAAAEALLLQRAAHEPAVR